MKQKEQNLELYPNTAYFGAGFLSSGLASNPNICLKRCAASKKCTGAWFEGRAGGSGYCQIYTVRWSPWPCGWVEQLFKTNLLF